MIKVAIIEDDDTDSKNLIDCLERYGRENSEEFNFTRYKNAVVFLEERKRFDIVFMDIMMPNMSGMEAARKFRQYDNRTALIFVTTMAQFAINGYEVDAKDYIVKPVTYERLLLKLHKIINSLSSNSNRMIPIYDTNGTMYVSDNEVIYIEVRGHKLTYHTIRGNFCEYNGSLNSLESILKERNFMRCNACYLVNPIFIEKVNRKDLMVVLKNGEELKISQPRRKSFMDELTNWLGQGTC